MAQGRQVVKKKESGQREKASGEWDLSVMLLSVLTWVLSSIRYLEGLKLEVCRQQDSGQEHETMLLEEAQNLRIQCSV